jgi:hypothetical protein
MRRGPRLTFIIATIVSAAIVAWLSAIPAHAVQGTIKVTRSTGTTTCSFGSAAATSVDLDTACNGTSSVQITDRSGTTGAKAEALAVSGSSNQLVIKNIVLKNNGASVATIEIDVNHTFSSVDTNGLRSYGIGNAATFSRLASGVTVLAVGNSITKRGFFTYFDNGAQCIAPAVSDGTGACRDEIASVRSYSVPSTGSTSQNTIPIPSQTISESSRKCADLISSAPCTLGEKLRTVLTVVLKNPGDLVTIPGGDHTIGGSNAGEVNAALAVLSLALRFHQNTRNAKVNPFDNGTLTLELLCNPSISCPINVDPTSFRFGPGAAEPRNDPKLLDVDQDGDQDWQINVNQQDTGIVCGDTSATLSGIAHFPNLPGSLATQDFPFDAVVGFYTDSSVCGP